MQNSFLPPRSSPVRPLRTAAAEAAAAYLGVIELEVSHAAAAGRASERASKALRCLSVCLCLAAFYAKRRTISKVDSQLSCVREEAGGEQQAEFMHLLLERARE